MKMKNKTILFSMIIISLLFVSISGKAEITTDVEYPNKVRQGKMFQITINFYYSDAINFYNTDVTDCLYSERANVWLFTAINDNILTQDTIRRASDCSDDLRPESMSFAINTAVRGYEEGDIFKFQIKYATGIKTTYDGIEISEFVEFVYTELYEVMIIAGLSTLQLIFIYAGSALAGICIIVVIYILIKKRK